MDHDLIGSVKADERGKFDQTAPDDEVHAAISDFQRSMGAYRRTSSLRNHEWLGRQFRASRLPRLR